MTREAVSRAERIWHEDFEGGVAMPDGETVTLAEHDFYHIIDREPRILRNPHRLRAIVENIFEIRGAKR